MKYVISSNNICVLDSWKYTKSKFLGLLDNDLREHYPDHVVLTERTDKSLLREWGLHTLLYKLGMWKSHTKDVDLNYPQSRITSFVYWLFGGLSLIFLK